jgi:eukaryotic translation initiation factor 2C
MPPRGRGGAVRGGGPAPSGAILRGGSVRGPPGAILPAGSHITTVGVPRPGYGAEGQQVVITINAFQTTIPDSRIFHYDGQFHALTLLTFLPI